VYRASSVRLPTTGLHDVMGVRAGSLMTRGFL
jgi:hypothetical protein